ncbi:hypothetical protein QOL99_10790 [Deinococcus sp. MIMF12]|uniref:REase associating with pPIWI RE domain-containing protein n=1 Tax=Deinococcus rhizophilus TaxID=3049544 RepID=A0ABT7JHV3_9DEIO|nr:hypothetical protein [Deinococcus rhizophilus]MDL2344635.1 hypothetical protein [Deinococcus rhizophilus]
MPEHSTYALDTLRLLAAGLVRQHNNSRRGAILDARDEQGRTVTPVLLLRAQARISRLQIASGQVAVADSLHRLVADACKPLKDWAPATLLSEVTGMDDLVLIDPEYRIPTPECIDLAQEGGDLDNFRENEWHDKLRATLGSVTNAKWRARAYTMLRRFIVEHPAATDAELKKLTDELDDITVEPVLGPLLREMYRPVGGRGESVRRCDRCHSVVQQGPTPHCSSELCRVQDSLPDFSDPMSAADLWALRRELVYFWVNPGRAELKLFDALREVREDVDLYPHEDEADIAIGGDHEVGLDLKDHRRMTTLAKHFQKSRGGLASYRRAIVVVTDRGTPAHGEARRDQLREEFSELGIDLEVMTEGDVLRTFGRGGRA